MQQFSSIDLISQKPACAVSNNNSVCHKIIRKGKPKYFFIDITSWQTVQLKKRHEIVLILSL